MAALYTKRTDVSSPESDPAATTERTVYNNAAISFSMPRLRPVDPPPKKAAKRGSRIAVPDWWVELSEERYKSDEEGLNYGQLGDRLAKRLGRPKAWSHAKVSRFFGKKTVTGEVADALRLLYPDLPEYVYFPQDAIEAIAYQSAKERALARREAERRAMEERERILMHRAGVTTPDPAGSPHVANRQPDPLRSSDGKIAGEEAGQDSGAGGRPRRMGARRA